MQSLSLHEALCFLHLPKPPNILPVHEKLPGTFTHRISWKQFQDRPITQDQYYQLFKYDDPFEAVGFVSGVNQWRCFDFDDCEDEYPMYDLLETLGLPEEYAWIVRSGSQRGWHVWFLADDLPQNHGLPAKRKNAGVYSASSKFGDFDHLELRYARCQTLVPPSWHPSQHQYQFWNDPPKEMPEKIETSRVIDAFFSMTQAKPVLHYERKRPNTQGQGIFDELKAKLTPEDVFKALNWNYQEDGINFVGPCPLHDSQSGTCLRWHRQDEFFHCFHAGCEKSGDIIALIELFFNITPGKAATWARKEVLHD